MNIKTIIIVCILIALVATGYIFYPKKPTVNPIVPGRNDDSTFCTADAKECPDGSYVGRQGPNCEFAECPPVVKKNPPEPGTPELE